jgi:hypothetical protein
LAGQLLQKPLAGIGETRCVEHQLCPTARIRLIGKLGGAVLQQLRRVILVGLAGALRFRACRPQAAINGAETSASFSRSCEIVISCVSDVRFRRTVKQGQWSIRIRLTPGASTPMDNP